MNKEEQLQIGIMKYIRYAHPNILACHVANERQTSPQRGAKLKKMGVTAGLPDILIFEPKIAEGTDGVHKVMIEYIKYCGLAIELKVKPNKLSDNQKKCLDNLQKANWATSVCYSFDEAQKVIDNYLKPSRL